MNVLIDKKSKELVGQAGLLIQEVDGGTMMEIGYSILPKHWKKCYASEAAVKCRDYAFKNGFTNELISIIHVDNLASVKVAEINGMTLWKTVDFKDMPVHIFKITRTEWDSETMKHLASSFG